MGQQDSKPQIIQRLSPRDSRIQKSISTKSSGITSKTLSRVQCEGLLKLRKTPFLNCIQIERQQQKLFLQNVQITLKSLLEVRLNTNKLFLIEDVERMILQIVFTLAHLQENDITYQDISPQNIFYDKGTFKLLPNQLICTNSYQKLKESGEVLPSPELIIALRCQQDEVNDEDILQKSNVFILGMVLLQVTTLLSSYECYSQNYDILDAVINQRIILVQEYYGQKIAKIIANMLDYDYTQRLNFKKLSIWINNELQHPSRITISQHMDNIQVQPATMIASKSETIQNKSLINNSQIRDKSKNKTMKNNSVYLNLQQKQHTRQQRNKIYTKQHTNKQIVQQQKDNIKNYLAARKKQILNTENYFKHSQQIIENNMSFSDHMDSFKINQSQNKSKQFNHPYIYQYKAPVKDYRQKQINFKQNNFQKQLISRDTTTRRKPKQTNHIYRNRQIDPRDRQALTNPSQKFTSNSDKPVLRQVSNQFYPKIQDLLNNKDKNIIVRGPLAQNTALLRIKDQIQKSKKYVQQIKNIM